MKLNLSHHAPPGISLTWLLTCFFMCMAGFLLYSVEFLGSYSRAITSLYYNYNPTVPLANATLIPGAIMPDLRTLLGGQIPLVPLESILILSFVVYHYAYFYQGSKSIYLMRRLPNRWELHRRCWTLPLAFSLLILLTYIVLLLLYYLFYVTNTPQQCLTPHQWQKLWRDFL